MDPAKSNSLTVPIDEFWNILRELKGFDFNIYKTSVKINFKIQGFKRVRNVVVQRNGVFGYFLVNQDKSKLLIFLISL